VSAADPVEAFPFEVAGVSDPGRKRDSNQDSFVNLRGPTGTLLFVADGMGGHAGGQEASRLAVQAATKVFEDASPRLGTPAGVLRRLLQAAHKAIHDAAAEDEELSDMGSTGVAALLRPEGAYVAHTGDSRAYLLRRGGLTQLTRDHTIVQCMQDDGLISPEQARQHPERNALAHCLGKKERVEVDIHSSPVPLEAGDRILLCSDGLYDVVAGDEIGRIGVEGSVQDACQRLVDLANERGGPDNVTVCIAATAEGTAGATSGVPLPWLLGLPAPIQPPETGRRGGTAGRWLPLGLGVLLGAVGVGLALWLSAGTGGACPTPAEVRRVLDHLERGGGGERCHAEYLPELRELVVRCRTAPGPARR